MSVIPVRPWPTTRTATASHTPTAASTSTGCCTTRSGTPSSGQREGYAGFIASYLNESVDWDMKGWGPFQAPIPHTAEGKDNAYEADAGLTDGGY